MDIVGGSKEHLTSIVDIFNYYIEHTNARFETEAMRLEDRANWLMQFQAHSAHQLFVAVEGDNVLGFACSQPKAMLYHSI